jgi:ERCC4-type nuclease
VAPGAVDLNLENDQPVNKNDISIMADIFEDANKNCEEILDDEEIQVMDFANSSSKKSKGIKVKQISENMKLEIKPKSQKNKSANAPAAGGIYDSEDVEIVLIVDNREKRNNQDINYFYDRFKASGIKTELRSLPLGDFIWILRIKNNQDIFYDEPDQNELAEINNPDPDQQDENVGTKKKAKPKKTKRATKKLKKIPEFTDYVLDFIVERKTADDLAASIMDGRYEEQKFRLKNCGINNVIYLVEGTPGQYCKIPEAVLKKASIHTQIFHGFNVMRIPTIQESLKWLT